MAGEHNFHPRRTTWLAKRSAREKGEEATSLAVQLEAAKEELREMKTTGKTIDFAEKDVANQQFIQEQRKKKIEALQGMMAAVFWRLKELMEHIGLLEAEVSTSRKFEAWKEGKKARKERNKRAIEHLEEMMESLRHMDKAGTQTLLLMLEEWKEMYMSS